MLRKVCLFKLHITSSINQRTDDDLEYSEFFRTGRDSMEGDIEDAGNTDDSESEEHGLDGEGGEDISIDINNSITEANTEPLSSRGDECKFIIILEWQVSHVSM